ncbi:hypothetical protein VNO77_05736 [Canavalia gladiata]|uniref:Uncharacterized protein n=1 Tax=Canavalia gladiata TaxID=3824 RepID=A0AAN9RAA3_CANGL
MFRADDLVVAQGPKKSQVMAPSNNQGGKDSHRNGTVLGGIFPQFHAPTMLVGQTHHFLLIRVTVIHHFPYSRLESKTVKG